MTHLKRVKMVKILLIGYGAMNQRVARLAEEKGHEIVGVIENTPESNNAISTIPTYC